MPINFDKLMLDPIYARLGIPAQLTLGDTSGTQVDLTVKDKTQGLVLEGGNIGAQQFGTVKPMVAVRVSELDANGVTRESLKGLLLSFKGKTWRIQSTDPKPVRGDGKGELLLILRTA